VLNYVADMVCRKTLQENTINIIADYAKIREETNGNKKA
jgi:hypothetical protein